jgi:transmembrane sensor
VPDSSSRQPPPGAAARNAASRQGAPGSAAVLSDPRLAGPATAVFVSAGEQVTMLPDAMATPLPHHADLTAATAWMQRKMFFDGSKLSDVASEFNRYNTRQLVIEDPKLMDFRIYGVYSSTDPSSLLRFLQDQGLQVTDGETEIRIEAR